jgi:hypothetical protein
MKQISKLSAAFILSFATLAGSKTLTTDPLTDLPLYPATDSRLHLGNTPTKLPDHPFCKSTMQTDFYSIFDSDTSTTIAWYESHLPGFHKTHAFASQRAQDTFYNSDGTLIVSITGNPGKDGVDTGSYAVVYARFQPGIPEKAILSMNQQRVVCN